MATVAQTDSGQSLRGFAISMIILSIVAVVLRFWSRVLSGASKGVLFWWDDWTVLLGLPFSIAACGLYIYAASLGLGNHIVDLPQATKEQILHVLWISYFMADLGISLPKASVLFFYARIFTTQNRMFRYGLWLAHTLNLLWWISSIVRCLLFCAPVDKYWHTKKPGSCRGGHGLFIGSAVPSVVIDFFILILPLPMISGLSLKKSRKFLVIGVFICGYTVIAISLGRLITSLTFGKRLNEDFTYNGLTLIFWVTAEPAVSIIGCCLPAMFYLARRCIRDGPSSLFSTTTSSHSKLRWASRQTFNNNNNFINNKKHRHQPTDTSFGTSGDVGLFAGPEIRYEATAKKVSSHDDDIHNDSNAVPLRPLGVIVQKDVDLRSEARF